MKPLNRSREIVWSSGVVKIFCGPERQRFTPKIRTGILRNHKGQGARLNILCELQDFAHCRNAVVLVDNHHCHDHQIQDTGCRRNGAGSDRN
jgi:hypothetical protein